jgi:hypothetical protein
VFQRGPLVLQPHEDRSHGHVLVPECSWESAGASQRSRIGSQVPSSLFLVEVLAALAFGKQHERRRRAEKDSISAKVPDGCADQHLELVALPALVA